MNLYNLEFRNVRNERLGLVQAREVLLRAQFLRIFQITGLVRQVGRHKKEISFTKVEGILEPILKLVGLTHHKIVLFL